MESRIIQKFHAKIGNVDIYNEDVYYTTNYFLSFLKKYNLQYTEDLVRELVEAIEYMSEGDSDISLLELEYDVVTHLRRSKVFLSPRYGSDHFKGVNRELLESNRKHECYESMTAAIEKEYGSVDVLYGATLWTF